MTTLLRKLKRAYLRTTIWFLEYRLQCMATSKVQLLFLEREAQQELTSMKCRLICL